MAGWEILRKFAGMSGRTIVGRFAPSPTGAMHLGNIFAAVMSWLSTKSRGGEWLLRIEDLDPQRCKPQFARELEDALSLLGLDYDRGGLRGLGPGGPFRQSERGDLYEAALARLKDAGLIYGCTCRRADIMATQAPHRSDGRVVYAGTCRPKGMPRRNVEMPAASHSLRVMVENRDIEFVDRLYGPQRINLADECGDFAVRRADGAWAYQLAVVVDDAMMGVTEVVRGSDLLNSAAQQIYLYEALGLEAPEFFHIPLLCNRDGIRLSKRDEALSLKEMLKASTPAEIIGRVGAIAGILPSPTPATPQDLLALYDEAAFRRRFAGQQTIDLSDF